MMQNNTMRKIDRADSLGDIDLQSASADIWDTKYRLKDRHNKAVDSSVRDTFHRVAKALSEVEKPDEQAKWRDTFLWALDNGALPAGRIISNAGAQAYKPATSTINCTVSGTIEDSMDDILGKSHEAGMTLKAGCGIGYEFSTLRPKGAYVSGAGAYTSGPLSFMEIYDKMCFTVSSAGGRRGAQMATFDVNHPDVMDFIMAKRKDGCLRQFNLSLLITSEFIEAVKNDAMWKLSFPMTENEAKEIDLQDAEKTIWRNFPVTGKYKTNSEGKVACKVYKTVPAKRLWDMIMASTYDFAEPGFILIDKVNEQNNNWWTENIRATNPCGEQPLPPYGSCLLGSINLTKFVLDPFTPNARFDWQKYNKVVSIFSRMLDNVVEINGLPLSEQCNEILYKRRHGMGFLGLGSCITMMGMTYGDQQSLEFTDRVAKEMAVSGWRQALELSKEKGPAPIMDDDFEVTSAMIAERPEMLDDGYKVGDKVPGKILHARYSRYMQKIAEIDPELVEALEQVGARYTHHTSIAPTGTISASLSNNASNGIEPSFAHAYSRNIIREGRKAKEKVEMLSYELLAYRTLVNAKAKPYAENDDEKLPDNFVTSADITPKQHVDVQAAAQTWIDSAISKTANVPTDYDFEDFKNIYLYAYDKGLKGCTTFRFNPEVHQGVLVIEKDLENTTYEFVLKDGSTVRFKVMKKSNMKEKHIPQPTCLTP